MRYIYFGASWCGPCRAVKPQVVSSPKSIQIVDVDTNAELSMKYSVRSVPTLVEVDGEAVKARHVGAPAILTFLKS